MTTHSHETIVFGKGFIGKVGGGSPLTKIANNFVRGWTIYDPFVGQK